VLSLPPESSRSAEHSAFLPLEDIIAGARRS